MHPGGGRADEYPGDLQLELKSDTCRSAALRWSANCRYPRGSSSAFDVATLMASDFGH